MKVSKEQLENIGKKKTKALKKLKEILPNSMVTGSISLILHGVINKKAGDIDLVVEHFKDVAEIAEEYDIGYTYDYLDEDERELLSEAKNEEEKRQIAKIIRSPNRAFLKIKGQKICIFLGKKLTFKTFELPDGQEIKAVLPKYSIDAKKRFVRSYWDLEKRKPLKSSQIEIVKKHLDDILNYSGWKML